MKSIKQDIKSGLVRWVVFLATILAGWIIYAAIGNTWTSPAILEVWAGSGLSASSWNKLLENFNNLDGRVNNIAVPQFLWVAEQNITLTVLNQTYVDIPWTSVSFNLTTPKKVWIRANWSVTPSWTPTTYTHCWFKFVIDWTPYWNITWWEKIIWCWTSGSGYWRRCNWNMEKVLDLSAWNHTIKMQMSGRGSATWTYPWCTSESTEYSRARLFVETKN